MTIHNLVKIAVLISTATFCLNDSFASTITYIWTGKLHRNFESIDDPWSVGEAGKDIAINLTVDSHEADNATDSIADALFRVAKAELDFDNEVVPAIATPLLFHDYGDGSRFPRIDSLQSTLTVVFKGFSQTLDLGITVRGEVFDFRELIATPPRFDSNADVGGRLMAHPFGALYFFQSRDDSQLKSVTIPEPSSQIAVVAILACILRRKSHWTY